MIFNVFVAFSTVTLQPGRVASACYQTCQIPPPIRTTCTMCKISAPDPSICAIQDCIMRILEDRLDLEHVHDRFGGSVRSCQRDFPEQRCITLLCIRP